jgi:hypothetical protein
MILVPKLSSPKILQSWLRFDYKRTVAKGPAAKDMSNRCPGAWFGSWTLFLYLLPYLSNIYRLSLSQSLSLFLY